MQKFRQWTKDILISTRLFRPVRAVMVRLGLAQNHGHELLIRCLTRVNRDSAKQPLRGLCLVEIGSTRETIPGQGSTKRLARFCVKHGMTFETVDMDPENVRQATAILAGLNKRFKAVHARGEDYLEARQGVIDICYLDAFDIAHDSHSQERQQRYVSNLGVAISKHNCVQMHLQCARALIHKIPVEGWIIIDDSWMENGQWAGKGETAIPYLLEHGFSLFDRDGNAVALRRSAVVV